MKTTKILMILLVLVMAISALAACDNEDNGDNTVNGKEKYNATLYSKAHEWITEQKLEELQLGNAIIINDQAELDNYIPDCPETVDFNTETVVLFIFTDCYSHDHDITDMEVKDGKASVKTYLVGHKQDEYCARIPYKRVFMLKLQKTEINEVVFYDEYDRLISIPNDANQNEDTVNGKEKYNATLYSKAKEWMSDETLDELQLGNAIIINDQSEFDKYISNCPETVDFNTETVVLYIFTNCYVHDYDITDMEVKDGKATVKTYRVGHKDNVGCACAPYKRCFMLKLNKTEIREVVFYNEYDRILK